MKAAPDHWPVVSAAFTALCRPVESPHVTSVNWVFASKTSCGRKTSKAFLHTLPVPMACEAIEQMCANFNDLSRLGYELELTHELIRIEWFSA